MPNSTRFGTSTERNSLIVYLPWAALLLSCSYVVMRVLMFPMNVDELEFHRATLWVGEGRVPYRDFWEHHLPLQWILFAPFTHLGFKGILALRSLNLLLVVGTLLLMAALMKRIGLTSTIQVLVVTALLGSTVFGAGFTEYRVDSPMNFFYLLAILLLERSSGSARSRLFTALAGVSLALSGFCDQRIIPLVGITVLVYLLWGEEGGFAARRKYVWALAGGLMVVGIVLLTAWSLNAIGPMIRQSVVDNWIYESHFHSLDRPSFWFHLFVYPVTRRDFAIPLILAGACAGLIVTLFIRPRDGASFRVAMLAVGAAVILGALSTTNLYQEITLFLLLAPLCGYALSWSIKRRPAFVRWIPLYGSLLLIGLTYMANQRIPWGFNADMLAHQEHLIRTVDRVTHRGERVLEGDGYAYRRQPAYYFWFLTSIAKVLTEKGGYPPLTVKGLVEARPAAVIMDSHLMSYLMVSPPELTEFIVRNYLPLETCLWIPAPNAVFMPQGPSIGWTILRTDSYRPILVSPDRVAVWLDKPFGFAFAEMVNLRFHANLFKNVELNIPSLAAATNTAELLIRVDGVSVPPGNVDLLDLRAGQRLAVEYKGMKPMMFLLVPAKEDKMFQVPYPWTPLAYPPDFWFQFMKPGQAEGAPVAGATDGR